MFEKYNFNTSTFVGFIVWKVRNLTINLREEDWEDHQTIWAVYDHILIKTKLKTGKKD